MDDIRKQYYIELLQKLGQICPDYGKFFIGIAIDAETEDGNYGIYFDDHANDYPLWCGKCPECYIKCYNNEESHKNEEEPCYIPDKEDYGYRDYLEYIDCYEYTYDYQECFLTSGSGPIRGGALFDISDILLKKISIINREDLEKRDD
ncbi:MAG: hypothetical protein ACTSYC_08310 [Promethearchaeota archaeon]